MVRPLVYMRELGNDLEVVTISRYPEIEDIKKELKKAGAVTSLMSGSGPTVFGLFLSEEDARRSFIQLSKNFLEMYFLPDRIFLDCLSVKIYNNLFVSRESF